MSVSQQKDLGKIEAAYKNQNYRNALKLIGKLKVIDATDEVRLLQIEGVSLFKLKRFKPSMMKFEMLARLQPKEPAYTAYIGKCCLMLSWKRKAIKAFERSVEIDDSIRNAEALHILLQLYSIDGHLNNAERVGGKLIRWENYSTDALKKLITCARLNADKAKAIQFAARLLAELPALELNDQYFVFEAFLSVGELERADLALTKMHLASENPSLYQYCLACIFSSIPISQ